ncbi:MAG: TMEM175 family protein [Acidimicrobiia bacterium]
MDRGRLEAFSDGVLAIIITIMVLELRVPEGTDWSALRPVVPVFLTYAVSFLYVGIYWNNHHHLLKASHRVTAPIMWSNLLLLFCLSLFPFSTGWAGANHLSAVPTFLYGAVLLAAALAYYSLQRAIVAGEGGASSQLAAALGRDWKGRLSPLVYAAAMALAFVATWASVALYVAAALIWLIPDRRIEHLVGAAD